MSCSVKTQAWKNKEDLGDLSRFSKEQRALTRILTECT